MIRLFAICSFLAIGMLAGLAQTVMPDGRIHALAVEGIDLTWQRKYHDADSVFRIMTQEFPNHPAGYAYRAGVMQTKAVDHEMTVDESAFDTLISIAKEKAKAMIGAGGEDAKWGYFFLATAEGCDSYARVYRGDWMTGALRGVASSSAFKDAVALDSMLYDAYAGIGGFYYWRSRKTEYFNWLPFVGDDRPKAFAILKKTADYGVYNRYTALSMLAAIYNDAGSYDKAIECAEAGLARYPSNQVFLWGLTTAFESLGKRKEAAAAYERLLASLREDGEESAYNELVCRLNISKLKLDMGDTVRVRENLVTIVRARPENFPSHLKKRVEDKLAKARELLLKVGASRSSNE
jgi:tetratricopeptide (TPR) repeat protein